MTQQRIEAEIFSAYSQSFVQVRDNVFEEVSALVARGLLTEAHAMVPIVDTFLNVSATGRIAVLTADVPFDQVQRIVNAVGRIPGLTITRADYVDNSKLMSRE